MRRIPFKVIEGNLFRTVTVTAVLAFVLAACGGEHMMISNDTGSAGGNKPGAGSTIGAPGSGNGPGGVVAKIGYRQTILPLFQQKCATCHNTHSPAPMKNWLDYSTAFTNRDKIKNRVFVLKNMPMGVALSDSDRQVVADWVDRGAVENEITGGNESILTVVPAPPIAIAPVSIPKVESKCVSCHGGDGNPATSMFPRIAALQGSYIEAQLKAFKSKKRHDSDAALMAGIVDGLSDADVIEVAAFFSAQVPQKGSPGDPAVMAKGKDFFENGIPAKSVMACATCHSKDGTGGVGPRLASQYSDYLVKQYNAFKAGAREEATMMPMIVKDLDQESMKAIADYVQSL